MHNQKQESADSTFMSQPKPSQGPNAAHPIDALFALDGKRVGVRHQGTIGIGFHDGTSAQIAVGEGVIRVQSELPAKADLWMKCTSKAWELLLSGEGEAGQLLTEGALRLAGDTSWLSFLATVCEPPKSSLGVRFAAAT